MEVQDKLYWLFTQGLIVDTQNSLCKGQEVDCDIIWYRLLVRNKHDYDNIKNFYTTNYNNVINEAYEWANREEED